MKKYLCYLMTMSISLLFSTSQISAQEMRFGKYSAEEIAMVSCVFEPKASGVVLGGIGRSYFISGLLHTSKHFRIKLLDNNASDKGDVVIRYYAGNDQQEMIAELKAQTMNVENGKETVTRLSKNDFFDVDAGNGYKEIRFSFPKAQAGAILEYEYKLISKNLTFLKGWVFANELPTVFSKYSIEIPEALDYKMFGQGLHFLLANQERKPSKAEWTLTSLPSMRPEPYMDNFIDHVDKVELQLAGYIPANQGGYGNKKPYQSVLSSWQKLADDLYGITDFKSFFRNNAMAKLLQEVKLTGDDPQEKAQNAYEYVGKNFSYNGKTGFLPTHSLKEVWESKTGSIAELNLLLIALLNTNGITAHPLLISTKGNGRAHLIDFPLVLQFNELLVAAYFSDSPAFLNVYDKHSDFGYLPLDNLVRQGFLVKSSESDLIPLHINHKSGIQQMVNIAISGDSLSLLHQIRYIDYDAIRFKKKKNSQTSEDWQSFFELDKDFSVSDFAEKEIPGVRKQLQTNFNLHQKLEDNSEYLFVQPLHVVRISENPFKETDRNYPIDFNFSFSDNYTSVIQVPEHYELDDFPEALTIAMPDNLATFMYQASVLNDNLRINVVFQLNENMIDATHYPALKSFMEQVTTKIKEPVVLKAKL